MQFFPETTPKFNIRKAAQVVAFFASREPDGSIDVLKAVKLVYLADRASMTEYDSPITFDKFVSMPHGPVNSLTLNYINGTLDAPEWDEWVTDRACYKIGTTKPADRRELDELSDADIAVLERIWEQFGSMNKYELRDWTHSHCPEWEDPEGSSLPISYRTVFQALGKSLDDAKELEQDLREGRFVERVFMAYGNIPPTQDSDTADPIRSTP